MGPMQRERISNWTNAENSEIIYYFSMRTFKFPTKNDVYFFCSVDISPDFHFSELCPEKKNNRKFRRELEQNLKDFSSFKEMQVVSKNLQVEIDAAPDVYQIVQGEGFSKLNYILGFF